MTKNQNYLHQLVQGTSVVFVFGIFGFIMSFLFKLFAARYLGSSDFGLYSLAETIMGIAVILITLGIPEGVVRYVPIYFHKKNFSLLAGYVDFVIVVPFIFSLVIGFSLFFLASFITFFFGFPNIFNLILKIVAFILPLRIINNVLRKFFIAQKKIIFQQIAYNVIEKIILLIGLMIIVFLNLSIVWLMISVLLSILLAAIYCIVKYKNNISFPRVDKKTYKFKSWMAFSLPLFFSGVFAFFIVWSDNLIIGKYLLPNELGIYAVAFSLANFLLFFKNSFIPLFLPLISEAKAKVESQNISFLFKKSSSWIFGLTFPLFLIVLFHGKEILGLIYGEEYIRGTMSLVILATGMLINSIFGLSREILILHKRTSFIFWANIIIACINIALNILLVPIYGITGAAYASAISLSLIALVFFLKAKFLETLSFNIRANFKFIIAGVSSILLVKLISIFYLNYIYSLVISGFVYGAFYIFFIFLFKSFDSDDFKMFLLIEKKMGINLRVIKKIIKKN